MRLYLAGPSSELPRVKRWAEALEANGFELTHRWWDAVEARGPGRDGELAEDEQALQARADLDGIDAAEAVWILWPEERGRSLGTAVELGYALGRRRLSPIVVTGSRALESIFTSLAASRSRNDDDGFVWLCALQHSAEDGHAG